MKIAVTDACIFIDLYELQLTAQFFRLNITVNRLKLKKLILQAESIDYIGLTNLFCKETSPCF